MLSMFFAIFAVGIFSPVLSIQEVAKVCTKAEKLSQQEEITNDIYYRFIAYELDRILFEERETEWYDCLLMYYSEKMSRHLPESSEGCKKRRSNESDQQKVREYREKFLTFVDTQTQEQEQEAYQVLKDKSNGAANDERNMALTFLRMAELQAAESRCTCEKCGKCESSGQLRCYCLQCEGRGYNRANSCSMCKDEGVVMVISTGQTETLPCSSCSESCIACNATGRAKNTCDKCCGKGVIQCSICDLIKNNTLAAADVMNIPKRRKRISS